MSHRIEKVNDLLRDTLAETITKHLSLKKGVFVSVSKVDTSPDLRYARVFISVFPFKENRYAIVTLKKELHRIQKAVGKSTRLKIVPRLEFFLDATQEEVSDIEKVFRKIEKEK